MSRVITHSEIAALLRCPRSHYFSYTEGLKPRRVADYLTESIACHDALEVFYRGGALEEALEKYDSIFDDAKEKLGGNYHASNEVRFQRMRALIFGYFGHYAEKDLADWDFEEVEYEFDLPIRNPENPSEVLSGARFCGKIDGVWREKSGRKLRHLVEHKFLSQFDVNRNTLMIDQQVSLYSLAASEVFGMEYPVTLYNVSSKPMNVMRKTEEPTEFFVRVLDSINANPQKYFHRTRLCRNPSVIDEARVLLWEAANMIINGEPRYKFRNVGMHCNQLCRFIDLCYEDSKEGREAMFEVKKKAHEELSVTE